MEILIVCIVRIAAALRSQFRSIPLNGIAHRYTSRAYIYTRGSFTRVYVLREVEFADGAPSSNFDIPGRNNSQCLFEQFCECTLMIH